MVNLGGLLGMFGSKEFHLNTGHGSTNLPWYADIYTQKFSYFMLHLGGTSVEPWFIFLVRSSPPKIPLARPNEPVTLQKHSKKGMIRYLPTQIWPIDHDIITMSGHWPDITGYNPSNIFAQCNWSKGVTSPNVPQLKLGNVPGYSPIFKTACVTKNIWRIASIWLWKYTHQIFFLGYYLFLKGHSFPQATLSENCLLLRTDNVCRQN